MERIDKIGFGNLQLIQIPDDFCYGIDAVLLADFAASPELYQKGRKGRKPERIMDLGAGTGIIPFILSHKTAASEIFGLELQEKSFNCFSRSIEINSLSERITPLSGDLCNPDIWKHSLEGMAGTFDAVTANPPYVTAQGGIPNQEVRKRLARHEAPGTLAAFISTAATLLKPKGDFYMVHRPDRLVDICTLCRSHGIEPKGLRFVSPNKEVPPNIILIHCVKGGKPQLRMLAPLYVYDSSGNYTADVLKIYERN